MGPEQELVDSGYSIDWNDYIVELLVEDTDTVTAGVNWGEWTRCSNSCGHGTKSRTRVLTGETEEISCLGSCPDRNADMCKPYFVRGHELENGASPFAAFWPTSNREGNQPSDGYFWTDRLTDDKVFMGFVGDRCQLTCESPLYRAIFTSTRTTEQNDGSMPDGNTFFPCQARNFVTHDFERIEQAPRFGQYMKNNYDQGRCEPRYCFFTTTGWTEKGMNRRFSHYDCSEDSVQLTLKVLQRLYSGERSQWIETKFVIKIYMFFC